MREEKVVDRRESRAEGGDHESRWRWGGIGGKLFLSYLLVVAVGVLTLFLAVSFLAPSLFDRSIHGMMGGSGMMGSQGMTDGMTEAMQQGVARSFREAVSSALIFATVGGLVASIVASYLFSQRIVAPVRWLARASQRIARGHYAERVPEGGIDELGELGISFNQMAEALEEAEKRRLALIGDVAHELRTPLATIEGYAEGLLDGIIEGSPESFALIHRESRRLRRLVDDLQELSRAEAKQLSLHPQQIEPERIIEAALARLRPQFEEKCLNLAVNIPVKLPLVLADEDRSVQVLTNLLGNALRYTRQGGLVKLSARALAGQVEFIVSDTGVGIAPEHLDHIFERFYRVDRSRSRVAGGSGIGLTIAKHLVLAQGGTIRAESQGTEQGATFSFTLPTTR